jgi:hypothetical protein
MTLQQYLENLWVQAGGSPALAPYAAQVAMAENASGDPNAVSSTNDIGLWQINASNAAGLGLSPAQLTDPLTNAQAAVALATTSAGNGPNPGWLNWTTVKNNVNGLLAGVNSAGQYVPAGLSTTSQGSTVQASTPGGSLNVGGVTIGPWENVPDPSTVGGQAITATSNSLSGLSQTITSAAQNAGLLAIALAFIAGGFAWLAAPTIKEYAPKVAEAAAA